MGYQEKRPSIFSVEERTDKQFSTKKFDRVSLRLSVRIYPTTLLVTGVICFVGSFFKYLLPIRRAMIDWLKMVARALIVTVTASHQQSTRIFDVF